MLPDTLPIELCTPLFPITFIPTTMTTIQVKRVYSDPDSPADVDGYRVYADRLWPRGESKAKFQYNLWIKDIAPSPQLREWFHTDPDHLWPEFEKRYMEELQDNPQAKNFAELLRGHSLVTLLYSSRDEARNNAVVLAAYLRSLPGFK